MITDQNMTDQNLTKALNVIDNLDMGLAPIVQEWLTPIIT